MGTFLSSLRARLAALVLLAVLPVFALVLYNDFEERREDRGQAQEDSLQLTRAVALQQGQLAEGARQLLATLAGLTTQAADLEEINTEACGRALAAIMDESGGYANLGFALADGNVVCSGLPITAPVDVSERAWFQRAVATKEFAVGEYQIGMVTGKATVNFGYPLSGAEGEVRGVVFAALDLAWLNEFAAGTELPQGAALSILDRNGTVLARYPDGGFVGETLPEAPLVREMLSQGEGTAQVEGLDGEERLYSFTPLGGTEGADAYVSVGVSTADAYAQANGARTRSLVLIAVVAVLAPCAAWFVGERVVVRDVRKLVGTAQRLSTGDFSARTAIRHHRGEIAQLAGGFDAMAAALQEREEARQTAETELRATVTALQSKTSELESFTYSVSHDLKEPLRTIEAFSQFLLDDYSERLDDEGRDYLARMSRASARLKQLIEELLILSRLGQQPETTERVSTKRVIEDAVAALQASIEERGARVTVQDDLPDIAGDVPRLEQIFGNLIGNALKFNTSSDPTVEIGANGLERGMPVFYVRDNGIGIASEYHERVFGIFQRLHRREEYEGNGAGLAIVKRAVEALGGSIRLESEPGKGATFLFALPQWEERPSPDGQPAAAAPAHA